MATYLISYDLNSRGRDYALFFKAIESYGNFAHLLSGMWIVKSDGPADAIREALAQHLADGDMLFVVRVAREAGWTGFTDTAGDWLKEHL
jgi:hypothetical protein